MRFFNLLLLILFFYPIQLSGEESPADLLLTADGINCLTEYSGNIRYVTNVKNKKDTVIIAEDEYANYLYLKQLIKKDNVNVLHARDGYEVIDLCRNDAAVNMIFMDIKMPNMDGHTAAKMIKEFRPDLPIIAQTAYALESDKLKFADVFDDYLTKPIEKTRVRQIIKKYGSAVN